MNTKYQDRQYVGKQLLLSLQQLKRAERKVKARHPLENWIYVRKAINGQSTIYYSIEFVEWLKDVYLGDGYYLDLEISFYEKQINRLAKEQNIFYTPITYSDMSVKRLSEYFDKSVESIRVAIYKMNKEYRPNLKYNKNGIIFIKAEGVKWLNEKYYRKSYLQYLERLKLSMQGSKVE